LDPLTLASRAPGKRLSKRLRPQFRAASQVIRRLRKIFVRQVTDRIPGFRGRLQRLRYRPHKPRRSHAGELTRAPRPDFIIIGAPKCGTSWLQGVLNQHHNVIMVPDEIEYFSNHGDYPVEWYYEQFAQQIASADRANSDSFLLGEKSAHYCSMPLDRIQRVRDLLPEARLILMTRDPVSRHWAHAKRYFEKRAFQQRETAVLRLPRRKLFEFFTRNRALGEFSKIIANWTAVFPPEQLLIVSQEKTLAAPNLTFDAALKHLGLPVDYDGDALTLLSRQRNRGPRVDMPEDVAEFLEAMCATERQKLRNLFGNRSFVYLTEDRA
jgi:hypothetical protein